MKTIFSNAQAFFAIAQEASAKLELHQNAVWSIHSCSAGFDSASWKVPWAVSQSPWEVVNFLLLKLQGDWNFELCFTRAESSPLNYHFVLQSAGLITRPVLFSALLHEEGVLCEQQCKGASLHPTADLDAILRFGGFSGWSTSSEIDVGLTLKHPDGREFDWEEAHLFVGGQQVHIDINVRSAAGLARSILSSIDVPWGENFNEDIPEVSLLQTKINLKVDGSRWQAVLARNAATDSTVQEATLRKALLRLKKWPDTAFNNCWEKIPDAHPYVSLIRKLQPVMSGVDALHIFTDGSYYKDGSSGAWAFSVVMQLSSGHYFRWGYTGAVIEGCASSLEAEAFATVHVLIWLLSNMVDTNLPVTIHGDATSVGFGANGDFNEPQVLAFKKLHLRSLFQLCHTLLNKLEFQHVPAHAGQLDNELVDSIAKALAQQQWSPFVGIPCVKGILDCLIDWAWLLVEKEVIGNNEYPSINSLIEGTGFPELPAATTTIFPQSCEVQSAVEEIRLELRIFSANVRTLKGISADPTFSDKADLLAKQLSDLDFDIVALQETRSRASTMSQRHGFICLSAQAKAGRGGIEIWLNQHGRFSSSAYGPISREHCHVWFSDHTLLCLECDHPLLACDIVALYAPQSSLAVEQIDEWWNNLAKKLTARGRRETILLGDCNAKLGSIESSEIGPVGWTIEDRAGSHLRALLADRSLILPSTFSCWHKGPSATFHGPAGGAVRLDYIALPWEWQSGISCSSVSEVDLLNGAFDHSGVEVHLELKVTPNSRTVKQHRACYNREEARRHPETLAHIVSSLPTMATTTDVDAHWHAIATHCQENLQYHFPKPKRIKRQIFFSDKTWSILNDRKDTQKDLRSLDRRESQLLLAQWFRAWKAKPLDCQEDNTLVALSTIRQEKAFLLWVRSQQAKRFKASRNADLCQHRATYDIGFVEAVSSSSARRIFNALRPKRPIARNKGVKTRAPLPELRLGEAQGQGHRRKTVRVWEAHFSSIETAEQMDPTAFASQMIPNLQPGSKTGLDLTYFPTLGEFEMALRNLNWRKAPGYDGLGSELWQGQVATTAKRLYPLFIKAAARGQLPLQFRGGFLIPLYKSKGAHTEPGNFRGILLQDTMAKAFAKCWRSRLVERFSKLGAPFQYGCLKGKGVSETHLPLRLHLHIGARLRLATAVIFVDIRSAYYTVVKEFFFETQPEDGLAAIKGLFHRLHLPEAALDDFVTTVMETDLLDAADVPLVLRQLIQSTITASWFQIPGSDKVCVPATGTRPGDPLADVLFAYVMSSVLWDAYQTFFEEGLLAPWIDHPPGTTWADDTCILLAGECEKIDAMAATAYSVLQETMTRYGMTPTYGPNKTALMINYKGKAAAAYHQRRFKQESPGVECLLEHTGSCKLDAVFVYKHLGSIVDGNQLLPEIKARGLAALQAVRPLSRSCLTNKKIPLRRRQQLLSTLGISVLVHNVGTWRRLQGKDHEAWAAIVTKLYGSMVKVGPDGFQHLSVEELARGAGGLLPDALLHVCRLRLLASILCGGDEMLASLVRRENDVAEPDSWFAAVLDAVNWLEDSVGSSQESTALRNLTPMDLAIPCPNLAWYIRKAIRKAQATHQDLLQAWIDHSTADRKQQEMLCAHGWTGPRKAPEIAANYKCKECHKCFVGEAQLATHRQRAHGVLVAARRFTIGTTCQACGRDHFTRPRLIRHLQYLSPKCLPWCLRYGKAITEDESRALDIQDAEQILKEKHTGIRSSASRMPVVKTGRLHVTAEVQAEERGDEAFLQRPVLHGYDPAPAHQAEFVQVWAAFPGQWTVHMEHWDRFTAELSLQLRSGPHSSLESFKGLIYDMVEEVSWRDESDFDVVVKVLDNLYTVLKDYKVEQPRRVAGEPVFPSDIIRELESKFGMLPIWMTTRDHTLRDERLVVPSSHIQYRLSCAEAKIAAQELQWSPPTERIPRVEIAEACYFLILFSGHRRDNDIATCLHRLSSRGRRSIHPVCLDLCLDTTLGNLLDPEVQSSWLHKMATGQVLGCHGSPPCETYTDARWIELGEGHTRPRPLRTLERPWGLEQRDPKEVKQYRVGNALYYVAIMFCTAALLAGRCATMEHPRGSGPPQGRFRVWDAAYTKRLLRSASCSLFSFCQGPLGQISMKPTTFLCVRLLADIKHYINIGSTGTGPYSTLGGLREDGSGWRTAGAKEFPPRLCEAIAKAVIAFSERSAVNAQIQLDRLNLPKVLSAPFDELEACTGSRMGSDFWKDHT